MEWQLTIWLLLFTFVLLLGYRLFVFIHKANLTDWGHPLLNVMDGVNRLFCEKYHRLPRVDLGLPGEGAAILAANHVSGLDPLLLIASVRRPIRFLIAKEQYERFGLQWLFRAVGCIPVDRSGRPEKAFRVALKHLKESEVIALFPYGGFQVGPDKSEKLKGGAAKLALMGDVNIVISKLEGIAATGTVIYAVFARSTARVKLAGKINTKQKGFSEIQIELKEALNN